MAYKAEIQVGVLGLPQLKELEDRLTRINALVTRLNKTKNTPIVDSKAISSSVNSINTLNKSLERTIQLQQKVKKGAPAAGGGTLPAGSTGAGGGGKGGRPGKGFGIGSAISSAAIGGAFPLLFGQGAGAAAGGAIGGVVGELALGPAGGFAGSLIGTAAGAAADADAAVAKLAATLGLAGAAAEQFGTSFRAAGVDVQQFTQAVNQIQDISLPFEQQATAIDLAAKVSANYKGSITAVANAFQQLGTTGGVSVQTLTTLTKGNVPIVESLAKTYGVTKDKIIEMAAEGTLSVEQLTRELAKLANEAKPQTTIERLSEAFQSLTTNVLKALGPALDTIGNGLSTVADLIATGYGYVADVVFPKLAAALAPIGQALADAFPPDLLANVAAFFRNILIKALEGVVFVVGKLSPVIAAIITKFKELSSNPVFKFIADQVARLANFLGLSGSEVDNYAKSQQKAAQDTKLTADQARLLAQELAKASQQQQLLDSSRLALAQKLTAIETQRLERQRQFTSSLNEETAVVNSIAQAKQQASAQELQAAQLAAKAAVEKAIADGQNVGLAREIANNNLRAAQAKYADAQASIELERRQQNVAAYAADAARQTEAFNRAANEATNALNNRLKVSDALTQAALQTNNIEIQSLQSKLAQAQTEGERLGILDNIRDLEIANAALTLQATRTQIQAEVERQRIAMSMAEVKYRELQAVVEMARAQKVLTHSHLEALAAQRSALNIARDNYATSIKVADAQWRAADATYNAAVNAANLKANMEGTAAAAGAVAGAMDRVAAASGGGGGGRGFSLGFGEAGNNPYFMKQFNDAIQKLNQQYAGKSTMFFAEQAYNATLAEFRRRAQEFNQRKAKETLASAEQEFYAGTTRRQNAMANYSPATAIEDLRASATKPQVNITTGPVMQMDGTNYVTQRDLVSATGTAARQGAKMALEMLQNNPSSRRSTGVTR